jgi:predicted nucleic acid-binding protein
MWIDANVLLRFLTGEPRDQAERARRLMERAEEGEVELYASELVLAEVIWVLSSFYRYSMAEIADVIVALVSAPGLRVEDRETTIRAVELSRDQNVDYIDAMLALQAAAHGEAVCTFDKSDFKRLPVEWQSPG